MKSTMKSMIIASTLALTTIGLIEATTTALQNSEKKIHAKQPAQNQSKIPHSSLHGTYTYAQSGVPIQLSLSYTDTGQKYHITWELTAGPYWYRVLWHYGPDQVVQFRYELTHVHTGERHWINVDPDLSGRNSMIFLTSWKPGYASSWAVACNIPYDYRVTGLKVVGIEGRMYAGPTSPIWTGRSDRQTWKWGC